MLFTVPLYPYISGHEGLRLLLLVKHGQYDLGTYQSCALETQTPSHESRTHTGNDGSFLATAFPADDIASSGYHDLEWLNSHPS